MPTFEELSRCDGDLTIGGEACRCPAWWVLDLIDLWLPGEQRGQSIKLPGTPGTLPQQQRLDETLIDLPWALKGGFDKDGNPHDEPWEGLRLNIDDLKTTIVNPTGVGDGTRTALLTLPGGGTRTGPITVKRFARGRHQAGTDETTGEYDVVLLGTLTISVPGGELA